MKTPSVAFGSGADSRVNAEVTAFKAEMEKATAQMELVPHENARHGFTKPGGAAYQENANKESWAAMRKFLAEILR